MRLSCSDFTDFQAAEPSHQVPKVSHEHRLVSKQSGTSIYDSTNRNMIRPVQVEFRVSSDDEVETERYSPGKVAAMGVTGGSHIKNKSNIYGTQDSAALISLSIDGATSGIACFMQSNSGHANRKKKTNIAEIERRSVGQEFDPQNKDSVSFLDCPKPDER